MFHVDMDIHHEHGLLDMQQRKGQLDMQPGHGNVAWAWTQTIGHVAPTLIIGHAAWTWTCILDAGHAANTGTCSMDVDMQN
jgi:hypothetical protein